MSFSPAKFGAFTFHYEYALTKLREYSKLLRWSRKQSFRMLDIGTGPGRALQEMLPQIPKNYTEIVATDRDKDMLEYFDSAVKIPRVTSRVMDIEADPIPDDFKGRFDFLHSSYCLTYVKDFRVIFKKCNHLLNKEGELFFVWGEICQPILIYKEMSTTEKWGHYTKEFKDWRGYFDTENPVYTLTEELNRAGLMVLKAELDHDYEVEFENEDMVPALLSSLDFVSKRIAKNDLESYKEDYLRLASKLYRVIENPDGEKVSMYPFPSISVAARKMQD